MISKDDGFSLSLPWRFPDRRQYAFAAIGLFILLLIIYGNSFKGQFVFDDYANIVSNSNIHIKGLSGPEVRKAFHGINRDGWLRPLSYASFALNYYVHGEDVFGYHVVNFTVFYLSALFLFLFLLNTLRLPLIREPYAKRAYDIALLATVLWAVNPLQVTAVTYIVQRMAGMAGLFYILAMYLYLKGRTTTGGLGKKAVLFTGCGLAAGLAMASKENAAMLPVCLFLFDLILLQGFTAETLRKNLRRVMVPALIPLGLIVYFTDLTFLIGDYDDRTFTMGERLLTEPRVILFYVSQLLYPIASRLTFLHDFEISRSLFHPWTTLPAMLILSLAGILALARARRTPLLSFCVLFFLLNHAIEGSFSSLEIFYEHRNYLPSMLFFVPVAIAMIRCLQYFSARRAIQALLAFLIIVVVAAQGHTVYLRNDLFRDDTLFWFDNVRKAPNQSRPHGNLGVCLFRDGKDAWAFQEFTTALRLDNNPNRRLPATLHHNLGVYHLRVRSDPDRALLHLEEAMSILRTYKGYDEMVMEYDQMALALLLKGQYDAAADCALRAVGYKPEFASYKSNLALILLKAGRLDESLTMARQALLLRNNHTGAMTSLAEALRRKGRLNQAAYYWDRVLQNAPNNINAHIALLEIYHRLGRRERAVQLMGRLMYLNGDRSINDLLHTQEAYLVAYVPDPQVLRPIFRDVLRGLARETEGKR